MTPHQESTQQELVSQTAFHELLREKLRDAVRYTLIQVKLVSGPPSMSECQPGRIIAMGTMNAIW